MVQKGIKSLTNYMKLASDIGAQGIIFHPGSHKGAGYEAILKQTVGAIIEVLVKGKDITHLDFLINLKAETS